LRYEVPAKIPLAVYDAGDPIAPLVLSGTYQARLTLAGKSQTTSFEVKMDPRVQTSADDLRKQFELMLKMRDRQDELNKAVMAIRETRAQLLALEKRLGAGESEKSLVTSSADLRKKMSAVEEELVQVNGKSTEDFANYPVKLDSKFGALQNLVDSADTAPTSAELAVFAGLDQQLEAQLTKWREVLSKDLPAINDAMQKHNVPLIAPTASKAN
jgi:hypothetical protein